MRKDEHSTDRARRDDGVLDVLEVVKVANLFRWRADEAGVPPVEVDEELLDILRRILGYEGSPTSN